MVSPEFCKCTAQIVFNCFCRENTMGRLFSIQCLIKSKSKSSSIQPLVDEWFQGRKNIQSDFLSFQKPKKIALLLLSAVSLPFCLCLKRFIQGDIIVQLSLSNRKSFTSCVLMLLMSIFTKKIMPIKSQGQCPRFLEFGYMQKATPVIILSLCGPRVESY